MEHLIYCFLYKSSRRNHNLQAKKGRVLTKQRLLEGDWQQWLTARALTWSNNSDSQEKKWRLKKQPYLRPIRAGGDCCHSIVADMNNDPICLFSSLCAPLPPALEEICLNQTLEEKRGAGTGEWGWSWQSQHESKGVEMMQWKNTMPLKRKLRHVILVTGCATSITQHIKVRPLITRYSRIVTSQERYRNRRTKMGRR